MRYRTQSGFTLIELLVVIAIIGLLSSVIMFGLNTARVKARDSRRLADLKQLESALELYYTDNNTYPVPSCGSGSDAWSDSTCWASMIPTKDIPSMPVDPVQSDLGGCDTTANCHLYHYCVNNTGTGYILAVNMEGSAYNSTQTVPSWCATGGPNTFWMSS